MRRLSVLGMCTAVLIAVMPASAQAATCTTTVSSTSAATSAITAAAGGDVVCLADGSYGSVSLSQVKSSPGVTLRAANPGAVTVGSVSISGKWLAVEQLKMASLDIGNVDQIRVQHNEVMGGTWVGTGSSSVTPSNVSLLDNILRHQGGSGETDTIDAQHFVALTIQGNEMFTVPEDGNHQDGFQSIWGGRGLIFRRNWIRDGSAQGFFIKDGAVTNLTFEDNLIANRSGGTGDAPFQIYDVSPNSADPFYTGKTSIAHNTIWANPNGTFIRDGNVAVDARYNVFDSWNLSGNTPLSQITQDYNVIAGGTLGRRGANDVAGPPQFTDTASYDYQLRAGTPGDYASGRAGITWRPADQQYGPGGTSTAPPPPPPPASDTTPPDTTISSGPSDPSTSTSASFAFASTESGSTYQCKLDAGAYGACSSPKAYSALSTGSHTFSVRATDAAGNTDASPATRTWTISTQAPTTDHQPTAVYSYAPSAPRTGQAVSFDASSSACADAPCTYSWVDDGSDGAGGTDWPLGSGKTMSFTFTGAGTKNVRLTVTDADGDSATTVKAITVSSAATTDHQPTAVYSYAPTAPTTGKAVSFDASASACADAPCTYTWVDDGPDGAGGTDWSLGSGKTMSFTFTGAGTKYVRLTVRDADGDTATTVKAIKVKAAATGTRQGARAAN